MYLFRRAESVFLYSVQIKVALTLHLGVLVGANPCYLQKLLDMGFLACLPVMSQPGWSQLKLDRVWKLKIIS